MTNDSITPNRHEALKRRIAVRFGTRLMMRKWGEVFFEDRMKMMNEANGNEVNAEALASFFRFNVAANVAAKNARG